MDTNDDSFDDLWDLVEFSVREAHLLRSFLEYLRDWPDPIETKLARLQNWKKEVGLQLGSPQILDQADAAFRTVRGAPPQLRRELVHEALAGAHSVYFGQSAK